eukprot:451559-Pelagomonas_calceolata.AAC.4
MSTSMGGKSGGPEASTRALAYIRAATYRINRLALTEMLRRLVEGTDDVVAVAAPGAVPLSSWLPPQSAGSLCCWLAVALHDVSGSSTFCAAVLCRNSAAGC